MNGSTIEQWQEDNQRYLMRCIREVQQELERYRPPGANEERAQGVEKDRPDLPVQDDRMLDGTDDAGGAPDYALDTLVNLFGLSGFERRILLLCAGIELDARIGQLVAGLQGGSLRMLPTFSLALTVFADAHWSALSPHAPLRFWKLVEPVESSANQLITTQPLKIDENILFYLTGVHYQDARLGDLVYPASPETWLAPSQRQSAETMLQAFSRRVNGMAAPLPAMQLQGDAQADKMAVASYTCERSGLHLYTLSAMSVPHSNAAISEWTRIWNRQAALHGCALYLDSSGAENGDRARTSELSHFIENIQGWIFIGADQWSPLLKRPKLSLAISKPGYGEQVMLWKAGLGLEASATAAGNGASSEMEKELEKLVSQFNLSACVIRSVCRELREAQGTAGTQEMAATQGMPQEQEMTDSRAGRDVPESPAVLMKRVWKACCVATRPQVDDLIQRIEPVAGWEDIVLPQEQLEILKELAAQVKQRSRVYGEWGFAAVSSRGLGISALFTGDSGTGKTMASEVLANELQLDLYRVDLSQVVNKYIGETEKNLKRIFDAAEDGGAILLFDEADALFGKRSEVKDSHDRYGNIEVSYLLQRMEAYRGLAILTTNLKSALDKAFYRRIRFIVQFPFPDAQLRASIWKKVFPAGTPTRGLDAGKLSRLNIPGGNIRNIALNAAFIAAHEGGAVEMSHISRAVRGEYNKLEKPLNTLETGGLL